MLFRSHAEKRSAAALSHAQRAEYERLKNALDATSMPGLGRDLNDDETSGPHDLTEKSPLILPLVAGGRVYLAAVGHFTIGWRVFSDWKVAVHRVEGDEPKSVANFAVGMSNGRMTKFATE